MTIAKLSELLKALTETGAVNEDREIFISFDDENEIDRTVVAVTVNSDGDVFLNGN